MQLHNLKSIHGRKTKKRVGRGGKRGTYSGRGQKGQKSRAGRKIRPSVQDYIIRLPKKRGFSNKPLKTKPRPINLTELDKKFNNGAVIGPSSFGEKIKILGDGNVTKSFIIDKGIFISKSAEEKIKKAGGSVNPKS